jgi:hypothetical protein
VVNYGDVFSDTLPGLAGQEEAVTRFALLLEAGELS